MAREAGWKKSGIISSGKKFIIELNGTERFEFPLTENGKLLVNDDFLKIIVRKSNEKLEENFAKLGKVI